MMHVALGRPYRGHRVRQGAVVYCALEGVGYFANRVEAWRRRNLDGGHNGPVPLISSPRRSGSSPIMTN